MSLNATYVITSEGRRVERDIDAERVERVRVLAAESLRAADRQRLDAYAEPTTTQEVRP